MSHRMSRAEAGESWESAERRERLLRVIERANAAQDVRQLAASASPRIWPDRSAVVKELKHLRSFHAHRDMKAIALDVELIDGIIDLLGG